MILLVEDNPGDARLVREALDDGGPESVLHVVPDGDAALRFLERAAVDGNHPDVVLLDLNLPRRTGLSVLAAIRALEPLWDLPVVVFTSSDAEWDAREALRIGADAFLVKSADLDAYFDAVRSVRDGCLVGAWARTGSRRGRPHG